MGIIFSFTSQEKQCQSSHQKENLCWEKSFHGVIEVANSIN